MRILLDCDGVLSDFVRPLLKAVDAPFGPNDVTRFEILSLFDEERRKHALEVLAGAAFWEGLPVHPGAKKAVKALQEAHDVYCVTSNWPGCRGWLDARVNWLRWNFEIQPSNVMVGRAKYLCAGDVFVDDKPKNVKAWAEHNTGRAVLYDHPYNQDVPWSDRCTWATFNVDMAHGVLTSHQCAHAIHVDTSSINKWVDEGKIPAYRTPGGHRRIKRTDFLAFCRAHKMPVDLR